MEFISIPHGKCKAMSVNWDILTLLILHENVFCGKQKSDIRDDMLLDRKFEHFYFVICYHNAK